MLLNRYRFRLLSGILILQAILLVLMPPGLCACWLNPQVVEIHVHIGSAAEDHPHDYLNRNAQGMPIDADPKASDLLVLLSILMVSASLFRAPARQVSLEESWSTAPGLPPPRGAFAAS